MSQGDTTDADDSILVSVELVATAINISAPFIARTLVQILDHFPHFASHQQKSNVKDNDDNDEDNQHNGFF